MSESPLAVFRFDASAEIGGGHAMRCLTLAETLERAGWITRLAARRETLESMPALAHGGRRLIQVATSSADEANELRVQLPHGCDLFVLDHYGYDAQFEAKLTGWARERLVISDLADRLHDCEFLCDQTLGRKEDAYSGIVPDTCRVLAGSEYALLRPEFASARRKAAGAPPLGGRPRMLVSLGMMDSANVTAMVLKGLAASGFDGAVDVVLGHTAPHLEAVCAIIRDIPTRCTLHANPADMAGLMATADLAIGAAGTSSWERCCVGVPTLLIVLADNQSEIAVRLQTAGAARVLGYWKDLDPVAIGTAACNLSADREALAEMRSAALRAVDGRGAQRLEMALRPEYCRDGRPVLLRPARFEDAATLYEWQRHPETRRYARDPTVPAWDDHVRWLQRQLVSPLALTNLVTRGGGGAGVLRLDPMPDADPMRETFEISILMAPGFYRMGVGGAALRLARRLVPDAEIIAHVSPENAASRRLFRRAGYVPYGQGFQQLPAADAAP